MGGLEWRREEGRRGTNNVLVEMTRRMKTLV